jgi:hypothetical protein
MLTVIREYTQIYSLMKWDVLQPVLPTWVEVQQLIFWSQESHSISISEQRLLLSVFQLFCCVLSGKVFSSIWAILTKFFM